MHYVNLATSGEDENRGRQCKGGAMPEQLERIAEALERIAEALERWAAGPPEDLDIHGLAEELGVTPRTLHRWIAEGEAPQGRKIRNRWRWSWAEVQRWKRERAEPQEGPRGRGRPKTWERGQ